MSARLHLRALLVAATCLTSPAAAHDGPPYPIVVDEELGGHLISVWADPDVGLGTFYLYVEQAEGAHVEIEVEPTDDHLPGAVYEAVPAEEDAPYQLVGEVDFDRRGEWEVRFIMDGLGGSEVRALVVDVTPPGAGRIDLLWFLFPFVAVGFLWIKVLLKRRELQRTSLS